MRKIFLLLSILSYTIQLNAQNDLSLSLNALKTDLRNNALGFAVEYLKPYSGIEAQFNGSKGFLNITPEITVEEGTVDAFSQMVFKVSGFFLTGKKTTIPGVPAPIFDVAKTLHVFPVAAGVETSSDFTFINVLAEFGYVPYYQAVTNTSVGNFAKYTQVAIFMQGGYKEQINVGSITNTSGGKMDESNESINNGILRAKVILNVDTKNFFTTPNNIGLGFVGKGTYWFDMLNGASYYQIDARLRIYLSKNKHFDFVYQKGSGAPNFNQGDQFGTSLSINF